MAVNGATAAELMDMAMSNEIEIPEKEEAANIEDTENEIGSETEGDTEQPIDGEVEETQDVEDEDGDSNTQDVEEGAEEDKTAEDEGTAEGDENTEPEGDTDVDESEDQEKAETDADKDVEENGDDSDGEVAGNKDIDIEEYTKLKDFYEKLTTTEFTVNGRKRTGFTDVDALIKAQQAYGGLEKKFKAIKDITQRLMHMSEGMNNEGVPHAMSKEDMFRTVKDLESQMKKAAKNLEFERAALLRDEIASLRRVLIDENTIANM